MTWLNRPLMGYDTETTGVDVETDRIVTACVGLATQQGWSARNWLLRQPEPIPQGATDVHGITTEHANEQGQAPIEALTQIRDDLYRGWSMGMPLVGFNISYDLTITDRNLRRHGLGGLDVRGPVLDGLVIDKAADRFRKGSRKLVDVCAHYGITLTADEAHGAEPDARAACRLVWKHARVHAVIGGKSLPDLHAWQAEAYREQRESFAAYLAKQGKTLDDPNTIWPLKPYPAAAAA